MNARVGFVVGVSALMVLALLGGVEGSPAAKSADFRTYPRGFLAYKCGDSLCLSRPNGSAHRSLLTGGRPTPQWDPALAPNGRLIAFRGYYGPGDGSYALYVAGTNGCSARRLTHSIAGNPSWSPDGKSIAFDKSGSGEIWKTRADGTNAIRIAHGGLASSPSWSPDGAIIAFTRVAHGRGQIWTVRPDGTGAKLIHTDRLVGDQMARVAWSPDSRRIAFVAQAGNRAVIKSMSADGRNARVLTKRFAAAWNPVWLPRSAGIAFLAGTSGAFGPGTLYLMRSDGTRTQRLARLMTEQVAWGSSPLPHRSC